MNVADLQRRGYRQRGTDELRHDLTAGCASLGKLAAEWRANGVIRDADMLAVERTLTGLHHVLIALRAGSVADAA